MTYGEALAILGLDMAATRSQWKSAYVRLSRFWDQTTNRAGIAPTMYRQVRVAYRYLLDHPAPGPAGPPGATGPAGADGTDGQDGEDGAVPPPE